MQWHYMELRGETEEKENSIYFGKIGTFGIILKMIFMGNISFKKMGEILSIGTFSNVQKVSKVNKGNWRKKEKMEKIRIIKEFREYAENLIFLENREKTTCVFYT